MYDWNERDRRGPVLRKAPLLLDETIRDGLQSPSVRDPTIEQKMELVRMMARMGIDAVDLSTTVLGLQLRLPVLSAPVAYQGALHADGEVGLARACAAVGVGYCLSTFANAAPAEVAAATPDAALLYQVYVFRDHAVTDELVAEAVAAGFAALLLTVDLPRPGARDRELRHRWEFVDDELPAIVRAHARGVSEELLVTILMMPKKALVP